MSHNFYILIKNHYGDQTKKNEMGRTCSIPGEEEKYI